MGIILMTIAQEHLLYENNIDKALSVFSDSFGGGCPEELQLALLKGDKLILVDEEEQSFIVVDRSKYMHLDKMYPKIDFVQWFTEKHKQMLDHCKDLETGLEMLISKFRYRSTYHMDFSVESVIKYIYGKDEDLLDEIREDYELNQMSALIRLTKEFIETSFALGELARKISGLYHLDIEFNTYDVTILAQKMQGLAVQDYGLFLNEPDTEMLDAYMDASKEIDNVLSKGIEPVDIMQNYSAGWLSPDGLYYALNGEIANMLHNQIADALCEAGVIPADEDDNPDVWLEQHGWVKIHGNNVHYAGNLNVRLGKPIVHITEKQIEIIKDYITNCHACEIKAGWRLERTSIGMFTLLATKDKLALYKKYFDF